MTGRSADPTEPLEAVEAAETALRLALADRLRSAVATDNAVVADLREWANGGDLGGDFAVETAIDRAAARQASVLTNHVRYRAAVGDRPPDDLRRTPVTPFAGLRPPEPVTAALGTLESSLAAAPDVTVDLLGSRYAEALSDEERRSRGQFYTPPAVAELVTRWALGSADRDGDDAPPRVLDPAAGTGTFQLAAYECLRERFPGVDPESILSRLVAVDVDEVALHLAALGLSARTGGRSVEAFDRRGCSFFDLEPGPADGGDEERTVPPVDAVVGNPPFVRAGDLSPDRAHFRDHLDAFGPDGGSADAGGGSTYADGDRALSRRSDAYVYFVTHATRFLRPGGRLGLVLPSKWLESDYGAGFRRFLADQYRINAVVGFGARAFDALVDTVLLLAERRELPSGRDWVGKSDGGGEENEHDESGEENEGDGSGEENEGDGSGEENEGDGSGEADVRFVRIEGQPDASSSLADLVGNDGGTPPAARENGRARVVRRGQSTFATAEKCSPYLRAPVDLLELLDHPAFVQLGDLAGVSRGVTTGANGFFLVDADDRERWGLERDLLRPAVRSIRSVESRTLSAADVDLSVVDVHGFLSGRLPGGPDGTEGVDPTARAKDALRDAGHDGLVAYVEDAEDRGLHEGRTCRARRVWFDLGEPPTPDAFVPKLLRERVFTVRNDAGAVPTNAIDCLSVRRGIDPDVLLGVLDSSLCKALMEVWGRNEAGMLQLMTYETRTLPVPDVRSFSAAEAAAVRRAAAALDADGDGQAELDDAVHGALDVDLPADRARAMRERLLGRRIDGGDRVEVPLS